MNQGSTSHSKANNRKVYIKNTELPKLPATAGAGPIGNQRFQRISQQAIGTSGQRIMRNAQNARMGKEKDPGRRIHTSDARAFNAFT